MQQKFEVRVISLHNQLERRVLMAQRLDEVFAWQFFDAIAGSEISHETKFYDREKRLKIFGYDMRINEIACFMSHRKVWEQCAASQKNFLILEDDVKIALDPTEMKLKDVFDGLAEQLGRRGIIRLGNSGIRTEKKRIVDFNSIYSLYRYRRDPLGAFAYFLSPEVAKELLKYSSHVFTPVDDFLWRGWEHQCSLIDIAPNLFFTSDMENPSTIGDRSKPKIGFLQKMKREYFRAFDVFDRKIYEKKIINELIDK
nr:glycosyltransferase family 25 protein [uncultured Comamonas sp.]